MDLTHLGKDYPLPCAKGVPYVQDLFREGLRLGESLARLPWKAARRITEGRSETLTKAADLGEQLGTLPFRAAKRMMAPERQEGGGAPAAAKPRIVVLGAGYGGLTCYLELQDHLSRQYDLVLVNGDKYHWFTTELHTYVAGEPEDAVRIPLSRVIAPPGRLVVGKVARVHPEEKEVEMESGERLSYDLLVFALGSDPEYYNLPGVAENSLIVGNWQGATRLRDWVSRLLDDDRAAENPPRVVVAGGGLTGVEVAGELADEHPGRVRLTILEAGPEIMAGFDPQLIKVSRDVLEGKGVEIRTGHPIARVEPGMIHFKSGESLQCDLLVWAGGVRGSAILANSGFRVTPKGRGKVDAYLRAVGQQDVYMVGDSASFVDPGTGREVPPTAQAAVQMGHAAGQNILRRLRGQAEQSFVPRLKGAFASLGRREGVGQMGEEHFTGLPAMLVKNLIEAHHAWETGGGVAPLVGRLLRAPRRFLKRHAVVPRVTSPAPPAARPEPRGRQV